MNIEQLEVVIRELSPEDFARLAQWFDEHRADQLDRQIEQDILSGKLDAAGRKADVDFEEGRCSPL